MLVAQGGGRCLHWHKGQKLQAKGRLGGSYHRAPICRVWGRERLSVVSLQELSLHALVPTCKSSQDVPTGVRVAQG